MDGPEDESGISKLAQSMPMNIALKRNTQTTRTLPAMERKTSWSDRHELVPPLKAAMRQQGVLGSNMLGLSPPAMPSDADTARRPSRSASLSRDRDDVRSYQQDPGAVFESLADETDETEDDGENEGTLREGRFVPPHVIARRASHGEGPEVGWRSLAPS
jgi:hypothetical protein